jgi:hypothetical protein
VAHTGVPLVVSNIDDTTVSFAYRFASALPHAVHGTVVLQEVFLANSGWRKVYRLDRPEAFSGDRASVSGSLSTRKLVGVIAELQQGSSAIASSYSVHLEALVSYAGTVGHHSVHGAFAPSLPFTVNPELLEPAVPGGQDGSAATAALKALLHPVSVGELPGSIANVISFLWLRAPALVFRIGGVLLVAAGFGVACASQRRRRDVWSDEKRIAFRSGRQLVDVVELERALPPGSVTTEVANFDSLVTLAVLSNGPILHEARPGGDLYAVDQPPRLYVHRKAPAVVPEPSEPATNGSESVPTRTSPAGRALRRELGTPGGDGEKSYGGRRWLARR